MKYENTLLSLVETSKIFIRAQRIQDLDVITYNDVLCVCMRPISSKPSCSEKKKIIKNIISIRQRNTTLSTYLWWKNTNESIEVTSTHILTFEIILKNYQIIYNVEQISKMH